MADRLTKDEIAARGSKPRRINVLWVLEYLAWLFVIFALAAILVLGTLTPVFAGISGKVSASKEAGFGRIVIGFSELPKFQEELTSGIFVLSFDEPVDVDASGVLEILPNYVGLVRRDPDGRALRFALKRPYEVNIMEAGTELFIDLLPPEWRGLPPPLPVATVKALTQKAIEAERKAAEEEAQRKSAKIPYTLKVRVARYPTFSRVVFDWNKFVTANLARDGRKVELKFNKYAPVDLAQLKTDPPKFLHSAEAQATPNGMSVNLSVDEDVDVRGFREGLTFVVDLTGPDAAAQSAALSLSDQVGGKKKPRRGDGEVPSGRTEFAVLAGKRTDAGPEESGGRRQSDASVVTKNIDPAVLSETSFAKETPKSPDVSGQQAVSSFEGRGGPAAETVTVTAEQSASPDRAKSEKSGAAGSKPENRAKASQGSEGKSKSLSGGDGLRFTFQFDKPVAAAVFRRGRNLWAVFDSNANLDLSELEARAGGGLEDVMKVQLGDAQYVRMKFSEPQLAHVSHSNNGWHLTVGDMATGKTSPLHLNRALREDKRSLVKVAMKDYGRVHWLTDPELGDRLAVVTALPPQRHVAKPHELVDFAALPTAHGLVIQPRSDDIAVRLYLDEVLITRKDGLTLSAGTVTQYVAGKKPLRNTARAGYINFHRWRIDVPSELSNRIHDMQREIAQSPRDQMNAKRFDLATLYTANGFYPEALGLLNRMANVDSDIESDPAFRALHGATLASMARIKEARKDFEVHALANDIDASLWRGLIATKEQNWSEALYQLKEGYDALDAYPPDIKARFRLAAVRAALESDKLTRAADDLNAMPRESLPPVASAEFDLLTGRYLERIGRKEEAREAYEAALRSDVAHVVSEARLYATVLDLQMGTITKDEALKALEGLQLFWRGDDIELRTLRVLADLYVKEGRYRDAFTMMRNSVEAFPDRKLARHIQDDMKQVFKNLFLHGEGDQMEAVKSLSLFYDFRELTPVGRLGDEMIRGLADRLVTVDLLDQASELLDHQVHKRLKGAARAQVATRLAMVHLMNHKPDLALRIIRQTRQAGLPEEMQKNRNLLEARALGELGRAAAAVEILNTMDGESVERLKADAYWSAQEWRNAGSQLEKMLGGRWRNPEPLNDQDRFDVLRAAIAYSLADDQFALDRMRKKYYPKLVKTADADSFLVVTRPVKQKDVAFRNLAKEIAAIDTLDAFMQQFRARYNKDPKAPKTSATNAEGQAG
ncbi:MAG: tetratricopeptide repeat protein [Pseudomonadota bacterium]